MTKTSTTIEQGEVVVVAQHGNSKRTREEFTQRVDEYITESEQQEKYTPTLTHFCTTYGATRDWFSNNRTNKLFSDTIKRLMTYCESQQEQRLFAGKNVVGAIFALKNNYPDNRKDKKEVEHTSTKSTAKALTTEELKAIADASQ